MDGEESDEGRSCRNRKICKWKSSKRNGGAFSGFAHACRSTAMPRRHPDLADRRETATR